ncbi:MAG: hypothetical protein U0T82_05495 [Bacteroidales bacterium]
MHCRLLIISSLFIFTVMPGLTQTASVQIGTQVPLFYSAGFELEAKNGLAFNFQSGILTKPYDAAILGTLKLFGTDEAIVNTIGEAFDYGFILQPSVKYHFKKWYTGLSYSYYSLVASDAPASLIENYYGITLPVTARNKELQLNSELQNAGILFGREFQFKNPGWQLSLELSLAKTFWSRSRLSNDNGDLPRLSAPIDEELNQYFIEYGYLPSINVFLVRKLR